MLLKLKQIDGGMALKNDVEMLKQTIKVCDIREQIEIPSNVMALANTPLETKPVTIELNGICYAENIFFDVDHENKTITWKHQRFDIDDTDIVIVHYTTIRED